MLSRLGYEVEWVPGGRRAIKAYQDAMAAGRSFDAVIMDLTVPGGMGGKEAVAHILELDPRARVIVSSGYSSDPVMANCRDYGFKGVIAKPYTFREIAYLLKQVMNEES
jgi:two-component system cell cycle sensor histidine kinase/response regulator CckA